MQQIPLLFKSSLLAIISLTALSACLDRRVNDHDDLEPVRMLRKLPQGVSCEFLTNVQLREGTGCGQLGRAKPAQPEALSYNLQQQARQHHANVVILEGQPQNESWTGCASNGLVAEARLYRCAFGIQAKPSADPEASDQS